MAKIISFFILILFSATEDILPLTREKAAEWIQENYKNYFQKYYLSCEAAICRMVLNMIGIHDMDEDQILATFPRHPSDPDLGFVMRSVNGSITHKDGSVNWANYGAHAPVLKQWFTMILAEKGMNEQYSVEQAVMSDRKLIQYLQKEKNCLGAIIWVAANYKDKRPPKNEIGQVLGEHVQIVSPVPDKQGRMLVYDVWPWPDQPFRITKPYNRDMFDNEVLLIKKTEKS